MLSLTPSGLRAHRRASRSFERAHQALADAMPIDEEAARSTIQALAAAAERASSSLEDRARRSSGRRA